MGVPYKFQKKVKLNWNKNITKVPEQNLRRS